MPKSLQSRIAFQIEQASVIVRSIIYENNPESNLIVETYNWRDIPTWHCRISDTKIILFDEISAIYINLFAKNL